MKIFSLEGNIGVGKTTILEHLFATYHIPILKEPIPDIQLMERYYSDPKKYALETQLNFLKNRYTTLSKFIEDNKDSEFVFIDRSIVGDSAFAAVQHKRGYLTKEEFNLYTFFARTLYSSFKNIQVEHILILPPNKYEHLNRINKRNSSYEKDIDQSYLSDLNEVMLACFNEFPLVVNHDVHLSVEQIMFIARGSIWLNLNYTNQITF